MGVCGCREVSLELSMKLQSVVQKQVVCVHKPAEKAGVQT